MSNSIPRPLELRETRPEFDFADVLRRRALIVLGAALIVALAVAAYANTRPRVYEAVVSLLASASKLGEGANPPVAAANYLPILESPAVAQAVIDELKLSERGVTRALFAGAVLRANPVGGTGLLEVRARMADPELAAKVANSVADRAVAQARALSQQEAAGARDQLDGQLADAKKRYETALAELEVFRRGANIEGVRKDVEGMLEQRKNVLSLSLEAVQARARLDAAQSELARRQPTRELTRSIDGDPALLEAARPSAGGRALDLKLKDQVIDKTYETIDSAAADSKTELAGFESRLAQVRRDAGPAGEAKLRKLYELEKTLAQRETDVKVAEKAYEQAAGQYENARLEVSSRAGQLQILSRAVAPEAPLSRRVLVNALLAFTLAAAAFGALAVALDYARRS